MRKNINRGYQKLRVWQESQELYVLTCKILKGFPFELKKIVANQIASVDSVHRNIAEGYCRKGLKEYLHFLNISLASLGESVSGMTAFYNAKQINEAEYVEWDQLAFKTENGLIRLISSLQQKQRDGDWDNSFVCKENSQTYGKNLC